MTDRYTLDRDKLYEEVWAEPMTKVSTRYEISDVALAKVCRKMAIPVPERGYWARVATGQKPKQKPLPKRTNEIPQRVGVNPVQPVHWIDPVEPVPTEEVSVADSLTNPHRLTVGLQRSLAKRKPDSYGRVVSNRENIDVAVATESIPRVLRIVDAFVKASEARGCSFAILDPERDRGLSIVIEGRGLKFSLDEGIRRPAPTPLKESDRVSGSHPRGHYALTGKLTFKLREAVGGRNELNWSDRAHEPLETQLGIVIQALFQAAHELRERAAKWARDAELAREREEERRKSEIQHKKFEGDLADWSKAEAIRRFLEQVEQTLEKEPSKRPEFAERWLAWAKGHAGRLDPLSKGTDDFLEHYLQFGWDKMTRKR